MEIPEELAEQLDIQVVNREMLEAKIKDINFTEKHFSTTLAMIPEELDGFKIVTNFIGKLIII